MILDSKNSGVIRSIPYQENDIVKIFGKRKVKEFQDFTNQITKTFEASTESLIKFANFFNIPFAYLFLDKMPADEESLPDFRKNSAGISVNLKSCIASSKKKQEWFRSYLMRNGHDKFLENQNLNMDNDVIQTIKEMTKFDEVNKIPKGQRLNFLKDNIERYNIIVQQSGISQNDTHKAILFNECRGYAIYDEYAPLVFINSKDTSENGKIFTLLHEMAHILLKHSGISSYDFELEEEYHCNNIAAEILMPTSTFKIKWVQQDSIQENIERLQDDFKIASSLAIATKALLMKLIDYEKYKDFKDKQIEQFLKEKLLVKGGSYYSNIIVSNGKNFTRSVIIDTLNGYETYKEALNLLDIKGFDKFDEIIKKLKVYNE